MIEKDDWRLLNDVEYLMDKYINPTDGEEITKHAPHLKTVFSAGIRFGIRAISGGSCRRI